MKKILISLISLIALTGGIMYSKNIVFADGIEPDCQVKPDKFLITYIEYSVKNENGNIVKSIKQGQYVISQNDINTLSQDSQNDNTYSEQESDINRSDSDYQNKNDNYKIHPINQPKEKSQRPKKKPRPIMPLIDTDILNIYYI